MYYRRCESCGSKALASATRCPRCEQAFVLNDDHGKRVRLVPCVGCDVVHPAGTTTCKWCGSVQPSNSSRVMRRGAITVGALAASAAVLFVSQSSMSALAGDSAPEPQTTVEVPRLPVEPASPVLASYSPPAALPSADSVMTVATSAPDDAPESAAVPDAAWEEATANTWVNVRTDRSREANVIAVLSPDDVVRLGARAEGWRQVVVGGATGWVDPRHFSIQR